MVDGPTPPNIPESQTDSPDNGYVTTSKPQRAMPTGFESIPTNPSSYETKSIPLNILPDANFEYETAAGAFRSVGGGPGHGIDIRYGNIATSYGQALEYIGKLFTDGDQWSGETYNALVSSFSAALIDLQRLQALAEAMQKVVWTFHMTMCSTAQQMLNNDEHSGDDNEYMITRRQSDPNPDAPQGSPARQHDVRVNLSTGDGDLLDHYRIGEYRIQHNTEDIHSEADRRRFLKEYHDQWNNFSRAVLRGSYIDGMVAASGHIPVVPELLTNPPQINPNGTGNPNTGPSMTNPGNTGVPSGPSNVTTPSPSPSPTFDPSKYKPKDTNKPQYTNQQNQQNQNNPLQNVLNTANQGLQQASNSGQQAASQAMQSLNGLAGKMQQQLPEGVLGLGPSNIAQPASTKGAGTGGRGGGAPSGAGTPRLSQQFDPKQSVAKASTTSSASKAGVSGQGVGAAGGGAPAAGARGGGDGAKVHKVNRALRGEGNGAEIIGESEAVVPVIGGQPPPSDKPAPTSSGEK